MSIQIVELIPDEVTVNELLFPDNEKNFYIYEHLRHYCTKLTTLPAITIIVLPEGVFVTSRHKYLKIAKELKRNSIQAVIEQSSSSAYVDRLLKKPSVVQLDWKAIRKKEQNYLISYVWYVFFFKEPLNLDNQIIFEAQVVDFFMQIHFSSHLKLPNDRIKNLSYPYSGLCAEFQAYVPIGDERWYPYARAATVNFHLNCVPIDSFQGKKFECNSG